MGLWSRLKGAKERNAGEADQVHDHEPLLEASFDPKEGYTDIYASEIIDDETCASCAGVDGNEYSSMTEARADYPAATYPDGGYRHCENERCRGTLVLMSDD